MTATFNNVAFGPLVTPAFNFTGDALQTSQALAGLGRDLSSWTLRVANLLNLIVPGAALPIPVSAGGTGLTGGTSGGVPYFNTATSMASSALLAANSLVVGGGAGAGPFTPLDGGVIEWQITSNILQGTANIGTKAFPSASPLLSITGNDTVPCGIELDSFGAFNFLLFRRSNGTFGSQSGLVVDDNIGSILAEGYTSLPGYQGSTSAAVEMKADGTWTNTSIPSRIELFVTPSGSTTAGLAAKLQAPAAGGSQIAGTTAADNATAGFVGEYLSAIVLVASEVSINSAANVVTLALTAGDWDVTGELWVDNATGAATINGKVTAAITTSSAASPTVPSDATGKTVYDSTVLASNNNALILPCGPVRVNVNTSTNVFLVGVAAVSAGTANGYGKLRARRMR